MSGLEGTEVSPAVCISVMQRDLAATAANLLNSTRKLPPQ